MFSEDPLETALEWQSMGASRLHIVDLDGAAAGKVRNLEIITQIARTLLIPTQLGGGIRDMATTKKLLKAGVERVILGTSAIEDPQLVRDACRSFGEAIIIGVDTQEGDIVTHGWQEQTRRQAVEFVAEMIELGARRFIYTDISRDGTLTEPNFSAIFELVDRFKLPIIAAGGISSLNHIKMLVRLGAEGIIIGKALYTGDIDLKQALAATC